MYFDELKFDSRKWQGNLRTQISKYIWEEVKLIQFLNYTFFCSTEKGKETSVKCLCNTPTIIQDSQHLLSIYR